MNISHKQVGFIATDERVSRAGEGAFVRLLNGDIMLAYTEYDTPSFHDDASAHIAAVFSRDEGESWGEHRILLTKDENELNIMSVSFLRLPNNELLIFYLKKSEKCGHVLCRPFMRRSEDDGNTWSEELCCGDKDWYYVVNNDRIVRLKSGRLLIPAAAFDAMTGKMSNGAFICMLYSDDNGYTWNEAEQKLSLPFDNTYGLEEPGLYEHEDGSIWCYIRTHLGCQWEAVSEDGGISWSQPKPNPFFSSPNSPMLVKRACGYTIAIFNPKPCYNTRPVEIWGRTPFVLAVSETDGKGHGFETFPNIYTIEDDRTNNYCYPAVLEGNGYFLVSYYHSNGTDCPLNSLKIIKVEIIK